MSDITNDFSKALTTGVYFDHCIDLYFFKEDMQLMYILKTPETGYKPDITVKGTLIEGSYAISSSISVTNMHYDIDINAVRYIKCRMYYKGLRNKTVGNIEDYQGHDILFSVLYADQEKEPPNRAIRFQCTVAANDYTRMGAEVHIDSYGKFTNTKNSGDDKQGKVKKIKFKEYLKNLCQLYNNNLPSYLTVESKNTADLRIKSFYIACEEWEDKDISITVKDGTINSFINDLNSMRVSIDNASYNVWKIYISNNRLVASIIPPPNEELEKLWPTERESGGKYSYTGEPIINSKSKKAITLYYTKSAYRNETIINVTTTFDDRLYPGCLCTIMANTIMGKAKGRSSKINSFTDEVVIFRATGKIDYEFSTTQGGYMNMQGPVIKDYDLDQYKEWLNGN